MKRIRTPWVSLLLLRQGWENAGIYENSPCHWQAYAGLIRYLLAYFGVSDRHYTINMYMSELTQKMKD